MQEKNVPEQYVYTQIHSQNDETQQRAMQGLSDKSKLDDTGFVGGGEHEDAQGGVVLSVLQL